MIDYLTGYLTKKDVQGLYDHLGTMPFAPGSWSNNWRIVLAEILGYAYNESEEMTNPGLLPDEEGYTPGYPWPGTRNDT